MNYRTLQEQNRAKVEVVSNAPKLVVNDRMRNSFAFSHVVIVRVKQSCARILSDGKKPLQSKLTKIDQGIVDENQSIGGREFLGNQLKCFTSKQRSDLKHFASIDAHAAFPSRQQQNLFHKARLLELIDRRSSKVIPTEWKKCCNWF